MQSEVTGKENQGLELTRYPLGSFKEFLAISIPLILFLLSGSVMGFCDRLFLARYSIEALEACTSTLSLCALFQIPAVRVVSIIQVFIGKYKGAGELQKMGACVWQMVWMSLFLFLISLPLCFYAEHLFFKNTSIASLGIPYFRILLPLNFLCPLG
ncbi:MAG: MATE family efflux transporter, partial [Rhabdochlamydiaceae bacterium]